MGYALIAQAQQAFPQVMLLNDCDNLPFDLVPQVPTLANYADPIIVQPVAKAEPTNFAQPYPHAIARLAQEACAGEDIDDAVQALAAHFDMSVGAVQFDIDELVDSILH